MAAGLPSLTSAALLPLNAPKRVVRSQAHRLKAVSIPDDQQLTWPITLNGANGVAMLDSANRAPMINCKFAAAAGLDPQPVAFRDGDPARGATPKAVNSRVGPRTPKLDPVALLQRTSPSASPQ